MEIAPKIFCLIQCERLPLVLAEGSDDDFKFIQTHFDFTANTGEFYSRLPNGTVLVRFTMGCFWNVFRYQCLIEHEPDNNR